MLHGGTRRSMGDGGGSVALTVFLPGNVPGDTPVAQLVKADKAKYKSKQEDAHEKNEKESGAVFAPGRRDDAQRPIRWPDGLCGRIRRQRNSGKRAGWGGYTWQGLEEKAVWTVDEASVPDGYRKSIAHTGNNWTITNRDVQQPAGQPEPPVPQTGDEANVHAWLVMMLSALLGIAFLGGLKLYSRKRGKRS